MSKELTPEQKSFLNSLSENQKAIKKEIDLHLMKQKGIIINPETKPNIINKPHFNKLKPHSL